ncbi:MAG: hypothetical protein AAGF26_02340 [Cyanobacteria bacterium P01_G01_bin.49]
MPNITISDLKQTSDKNQLIDLSLSQQNMVQGAGWAVICGGGKCVLIIEW